MRRVLSLLCALVLPSWLPAADHVALVIGINKYTNLAPTMQLTSPVADATDVAAALKGLGYTIVTGAAVTNAKKEDVLTAIESFVQTAKNAEAAVFYFSGHGVQVGEDNYLLASDTPKLTGMSVLKGRAVLLRDLVMVGLEEAGVKNKAIILDCCRDNPFAAQLEVALASVGKSIKTKSVGEITGYGPGFYLAFATSPGTVASDGNGQRNSPFTAAMLKSLPGGAGKDIELFFRDVKFLLGDAQVSWTNNSLRTTFTLARATATKEESKPSGATGLSEAEIQRRVAVEVAAELSRNQAMKPEAPKRSAPPVPVSQVGATLQVELLDGETMTFCYCPAGSFTMGSPASEEYRNESERQVEVRLGQGFWMAQTECTQEQWHSIMSKNPSQQKGSKGLPVENVSWENVEAFISRLNQIARLPPGLTLALPTEAQWEYACRAGSMTAYAFGDTFDGEQGNFKSDLSYGTTKKTTPPSRIVKVGSYAPNAWGLHDMHGNVHEWCKDAWDGASNLPGGTDPVGTAGELRMNRGGSWLSTANICRSAKRLSLLPDARENYLGFRLALVHTD